MPEASNHRLDTAGATTPGCLHRILLNHGVSENERASAAFHGFFFMPTMEMEKSEKTQTPALTPEELSQRSPTPSTDDEEEVHYVGHLKFSLIFIGLCLSVFQVALVCFLRLLLNFSNWNRTRWCWELRSRPSPTSSIRCRTQAGMDRRICSRCVMRKRMR